jgi:arginine:pyruvate transaminase
MITPVSNPSGWNLNFDDRTWIADTAYQNNVSIIADEVYLDGYRSKTDYYPMHKYGNGNISINSLTKIYSLGQIRFGWIISDKDTIEIARRVFMTFSGSMASPTMRIAGAALHKLDEVDAAIEDYRKENLPKLRKVLKRFSIIWNEPEAGIFGCFELPNKILAEDFADGPCKDNDLLVIPGSMFCDSLKNWVRVAWSIEPKSFETAIYALEKALESALT